jgi:trigger factor
MPEISVADMSDVSIKRPQVEVAESDVDAMLDKLRKQRASWSAVERATEEGDQVLVSYKGFIDGEAFEGGSAEDVPLDIGSKSFIEGFEQGLVGASAGDNRSLELKFPDEYRVEHLAGKDVTFEVELKEVRHQVLPDIDEGFVKQFGIESGSADDFRTDIRKNMEHEVKQKIKSTVKDRIMNALLEANQIDVPKSMVEQECEAIKKQAMENMAQRGQSSNLDLPADVFSDQAKRRVSLGLLMGEIMSGNELSVDQDRVNSTIEEMAQSYEKPEEVIEYYKNNPDGRSSLESLVLEDQVVDWVVGQIKVEEESLGFDDFMNPESK